MAVSNYIPSSRVMQPGVCTSSTRPASPYTGMTIYETDTNKMLVWNGSAWVIPNSPAQNPTGLELITTAGCSSGGTASNGVITVGATVPSVSITSCFNSTYDNYMISFSNITATAGGGVLQMKLMVGTTPQTNGWYGNVFYIANGAGGTFSNATSSNVAYAEVLSLTSTTNFKNAGVVHLQQPYLATQTRHQYTNADDYYFRFGASQLSNTTQYDGVQFVPSSGTLTGGTITVYGYRK
jgi:hypothetical protein